MSVYLKRQSGSDAVPDGMPSFPPEYANFSASDEILSITGVFTALALAVVLLRIYVRAWMVRFFGPDDFAIVFAMALSIFVMVCFAVEVQYGLGKHAAVMLMDPAGFMQFSKWLYIHSIVVMVAVSTVKVSIALFLMRLAQRTRNVRFLWGVIVFLLLFTISCAGTLVFQCTPVAAAWDVRLRPPTGNAKCFSMTTFRNIGMFNSAVNIATDILFASLPVPLIWQLKVNLRTKITLASILSLGFFASAAAIVKAVNQFHVLEDPDWTVHDSFNVWNDIELNIGIIAASLPALKPLFNWFLETARAITSSGGRSGNRRPTGYGAYSRSVNLGYMKQPESSSIALTSMSRSRTDAEKAKLDPYFAQVTVGSVKEQGGKREGSSAASRESSGATSATPKDGEWDLEARKASADGILPYQGERTRPNGHVIIRTTEVRVS